MPIYRLAKDSILFPSVELAGEDGLLALGGDLQPERLIAAYRHGIFPWYAEGDPILWWYLNPRLVLFPSECKVSRRLQRSIRQRPFRVSFDENFSRVISDCAAIRIERGIGTWITKDMHAAYNRLHALGYAHSVECWQDDILAGGLYGVRLGEVFFGESMFTRITDASKIAFVHLVHYLQDVNVQLIDCQMTTRHLVSFGAREISSSEFQFHLHQLIDTLLPDGKWHHEKTEHQTL